MTEAVSGVDRQASELSESEQHSNLVHVVPEPTHKSQVTRSMFQDKMVQCLNSESSSLVLSIWCC